MKYYINVFKNYAAFSGRARRKEYWYFALFHFIVAIILAFIGAITQSMLLYGLYVFAALIPAIAVGVRRMHDVGKSGWFILIPIYSLILTFTKGDQGENQYGDDPKVEKEETIE